MQSTHRPAAITSKFNAIYSKIFQGVPLGEIDQHTDADHLIQELLDLKVDRQYLSSEIDKLSKDVCLGRLKPLLNLLFTQCIKWASQAKYEDVKKVHALETLTVLVEGCLKKNLSGWEVMEVVSGSVGRSDKTFNGFTSMLNVIIGDENAPVETRYQALQLGLVFMCSVSQLSPGAYFLRRNLFPSILNFIKSPGTEPYILQAALFLAILANYHKSDAAKLNPYLKRIKESEDELMMQRVSTAVSASLDVAVKEYRGVCTPVRAPVKLATSLTSAAATLFRPDRLLARVARDVFHIGHTTSTPAVENPQPTEAAVALLPLYEFLRGNRVFAQMLLRSLGAPSETWRSALLVSFLDLASHLFTHTSTLSPRTSSYASLTLDIMLLLVEGDGALEVLSSKGCSGIDLCRKRQPKLPKPVPGRFLAWDILDCCNLWLRHNLNRRLPSHSYSKCIWICHRIVWDLQHRRIRMEYEWKELWVSILGLFAYLASKFDSLVTTGEVEQLIDHTLHFLAMAVAGSEAYLSSPHALYELIYELVRNAPTLEKQQELLDSLAAPPRGRRNTNDALQYTLGVVTFYKDKITEAGALHNVSDAMQVIVRLLEADGLHVPPHRYSIDSEPSLRSEEVVDFARYACGDGLALLRDT